MDTNSSPEVQVQRKSRLSFHLYFFLFALLPRLVNLMEYDLISVVFASIHFVSPSIPPPPHPTRHKTAPKEGVKRAHNSSQVYLVSKPFILNFFFPKNQKSIQWKVIKILPSDSGDYLDENFFLEMMMHIALVHLLD